MSPPQRAGFLCVAHRKLWEASLKKWKDQIHQTQTTTFISTEFFQRLTCRQQDSNSIEETSYEDATREQRLPVMMKDTPTCVPVLKEPRVGFDGDEAQPVSQHFILDNRCIIVNENLLYSHGWHLEDKREEFRCGKTRAKPTERPTDPSQSSAPPGVHWPLLARSSWRHWPWLRQSQPCQTQCCHHWCARHRFGSSEKQSTRLVLLSLERRASNRSKAAEERAVQLVTVWDPSVPSIKLQMDNCNIRKLHQNLSCEFLTAASCSVTQVDLQHQLDLSCLSCHQCFSIEFSVCVHFVNIMSPSSCGNCLSNRQ